MSNKRALQFFLFFLPVGVLLFVLRDVVFFGKFFNNGDISFYTLPIFFYHAHNGALMVQGILSGFPFFVSINANWFSPISTFLFSHLSATAAYVFLDVGYVLLAYLFTYLYARKIGLGANAAIFSSTTFIFSGQLMLWLPATSMTSYYFLLPACLYFFELAIEKSFWMQGMLYVLLGALLGEGWLSSHVQFIVYIHACYLAYVFVRLRLIEKVRSWKQTFAALLIPYTVSLLAGLPQIWAVLSFQSQTLRSNGVGFSESLGGAYLPWDFVRYLLPFWHVSFLPGATPNLYIGILPFLLLLITLYSFRRLKHPYAPLYLGVFLFCLTASIYYSPLAIVLHYLPFWNSFREPPRIMFIGDFAQAMLVGIGFEYIYSCWSEVDLYRLRVVRIFTALFLYVGLPVVAVFSLVRAFYFDAIESRLDRYFLTYQYAATTQLPKEHYLTLIAVYLHLALDQFSIYDPQMLFALLFIFISLGLFTFQKKIPGAYFGAAIIIITSINIACVYANEYPSMPSRLLFNPPETVRTVLSLQKNNPSPYRVYSLFPAENVYADTVACPLSPEEMVEIEEALFQPNSNLYFGIDSVEGYENYMPLLASEGLNYIGSGYTGAPNPLLLQRITMQKKIQTVLARKNVLRAMNIKYITSATPITDPQLQLVGSWHIGACGHPVYLYMLTGTWPRYFVTNTPMLSKVADTRDASSTLGELNAYRNPTVLLDSSVALAAPVGVPHITEVLPLLGDNTITFATPKCNGSCALFIGDTFLDGWSATIDGKPSPILRANYQYMAVLLAPGAHTVELSYTKPVW